MAFKHIVPLCLMYLSVGKYMIVKKSGELLSQILILVSDKKLSIKTISTWAELCLSLSGTDGWVGGNVRAEW